MLYLASVTLHLLVCLPCMTLASRRDRYLVHYALEGLSRVGRVISGAEDGAMLAQTKAFDKMLEER
eukprot:COSAG02_NODE_37984_length_435_cov_0.619048_2_plen_65_part_01